MIKVEYKQNCCGCTACAEICPRSCITMQSDEEGFLYPQVSEKDCIGCGLCEKVCPILNENTSTPPLEVYAAYSKNEQIRKASSSGGVFTALAETIINEGGVVFGARFDSEWNVIHSYSETIDGLAAFRGSKYVQSSIGNSYKETENFLKQGRKVLFSGTPCQIAGLKNFLRKNYENLFTVDVICHGSPSPLVWSKYVETLRPKGAAGENSVFSIKKEPVITGLFFRDKRAGWRKFGFSAWIGATEGSKENTVFPPKHSKRIKYEILQENVFMRGFLQHLYLRPSCHDCKFRNHKSKSDLTLGDFWSAEKVIPEFSNDKGISLIITRSPQGRASLISGLPDVEILEIPSSKYDKSFKGNSAIFKDPLPSINRIAFWEGFHSNNIVHLIKRHTIYSNKQKVRTFFVKCLLKLHVWRFYNRYVNKLK